MLEQPADTPDFIPRPGGEVITTVHKLQHDGCFKNVFTLIGTAIKTYMLIMLHLIFRLRLDDRQLDDFKALKLFVSNLVAMDG